MKAHYQPYAAARTASHHHVQVKSQAALDTQLGRVDRAKNVASKSKR